MNEVFENAIKTGKIAGAYLIAGASAETTQKEIDDFLMHVYCETRSACGKCPGCLKYAHKNHVDVIRIESKGSIKIDDVRSVPAEVANKAYEGGYKAVVIAQADAMTPQAQNALLKVVEEPPANTVFVMGAQNVKNILPTILSRCIILKTSLSKEEAEEKLREEQKLPTLKARVLSDAAGGDYHLALVFLQDDFFDVRDDMILALNRLWTAKNMATSATLALFLKHEAAISLCLDVALRYIADVLTYKYTGEAGHIVNQDKLAEIAQHARLRDYVLVNTQEKIYDCVVKRAQCAGLNTKLALESMLFHILEVIL
ncbi:MAG: DNA polymerase III subunit [Christensenella sp.]|uniref:DNA polymerase III subunit n=1 Tax=Christensenella sp. TaxID=1935934 RepID=UPI002B205470|nr:DNA polymerase III subunit [Christensenella sp.]MEA5003299.1 DNA polymerase III subunit [Christensenella sp.]